MLKELQKALATGTAAIAALQTKAFAPESNDEDRDALTKHLDDVKKLQDNVALAQRAEDAVKSMARDETTDDTSSRAKAKVKSPETPIEKLALACQSIMHAKREFGTTSPRNVLKAMEELGYGQAAGEFGEIQRANTTLTGGSGGFLVAENYDRTFLDLLYAGSSFMAGNPTVIPMPEGNYRQAGALTGATATYRGEGDDISVSNPTFRDISMSAHLLSNIVPVTNQLLRYSLGTAGNFIQRDGSRAMSLKMDQVAYLGSGAGDVPLGILNQPGINKVAVGAIGATPTFRQIIAELSRMMSFIYRFPELAIGAEWRVSSRTYQYMASLVNVNDEPAFPSLQNREGGTLMGIPVRIAYQFPTNLGAGTNETYIALISFNSVLVGEAKGLAIDISSEASYRDTNGEMQSAFSTDSTLYRFTMEHDFGNRHVEAVNVLTGVQF